MSAPILISEDPEDYIQHDLALMNKLISVLLREPNSAKARLINSYFDRILLLSDKEKEELLKRIKQLDGSNEI